MSKSPVESGLQDVRLEFVREQEPGVPPSDPDFKGFSPEIEEISASPDGGKETFDSVGSRDPVEFHRSVEESDLTISYSQFRFPLDPNGNIVDPIGFPFLDIPGDYPSLTIVSRREVRAGGRLDNGFREFLVGFGCRPVEASLDGDPSAAEPIPQELSLPSEEVRSHIVHQPATETPLVVRSSDDTDTNTVTIESEDGLVQESVQLPGTSPNTVETPSGFPDVDSIFVDGDHAGDIQVGTSDGSGAIDVELLENPLTGINVDEVASVEGIPALGSGSHADPISGNGTTFLETEATFANGELGERLHVLDLSVSLDSSREALASKRRQTIDVGQRTVEFDADLAGPFESAKLIKQHFRRKSGDLVYAFGAPNTDPSAADKKIVAKNVEIIDAPDQTRSAGDTNFIPSVTFQAVGDPAIEIINNS
jgi:hypothetical protein